MHGQNRVSGIERLDRGMNRGVDRGFDHERGDVRIVVTSAPAEYKKERAFSYLPWPVKLFLKFGLFALVMFSIFVLPNYLDCRGQRDSGMFYYGMTVTACTRQNVYGQIGATQQRFEDIARAIGSR
ncbi:hypothetical protein [Methylobacterium nonmethylotrophicum]|uniref:Uncharacterized protein n=1 Tax=Methylobacterium nonmethylotrophicum TaxID=1141884 RepID=A0A4Z0NSX8_9HYPH|nr:hypothetical protein [Methylobacterium nonmethylotrophicum]TGD99854.1 hypothetical protein EU555_11910 [Methylobacterium nonmethylotrophicum]